MAEFYKHFSEEEKDFIVKEFTAWQKMGLAVEEMIDDVVENVMELALSRELTAEDVVTAYEEFINMEFTEVKELIENIHSNIPIHYHQEDQRAFPGKARNIGVSIANYKYIAFLDCRTIPYTIGCTSIVSTLKIITVE